LYGWASGNVGSA